MCFWVWLGSKMNADYKWRQKLKFENILRYEVKKIASGYLSEDSIDKIIDKLVIEIEKKELLCKDSLD